MCKKNNKQTKTATTVFEHFSKIITSRTEKDYGIKVAGQFIREEEQNGSAFSELLLFFETIRLSVCIQFYVAAKVIDFKVY